MTHMMEQLITIGISNTKSLLQLLNADGFSSFH